MIFKSILKNEKAVHGLLLALNCVLMVLSLTACGGGVCTPRISGDTRVTMKGIGKVGRFGNQLYQYIFLKTYAKRHHLTVETPSWIGNQLFGLSDPVISVDFCPQSEDSELLASYENPKEENKFVNVDFEGYFQIHTSYHQKDKEFIQEILKPTPEIQKTVHRSVDLLHAMGQKIVSIHLRRGDFGAPPFVVSSSEWYLKWLESFWDDSKGYVLFIASDEIDAVIGDFKKYRPVTIRDLNGSLELAPYYPEFYILTQSDVVAISNSSFSSSAALLNTVGTEFFRPSFEQKKLVSFDPWSTYSWESWHH